MSCIVCATRGGQGSRAVQMAAIQRAKAMEKPLIFLYVADPSSLGQIDELLASAVRKELHWMGNTLLQIARQRAELADLKTQIVIREGDVRQEICRFLQETDASLLLLGAPRNTTANLFGDDMIEQLAQSIQEQTGVPVEVVRPESCESR